MSNNIDLNKFGKTLIKARMERMLTQQQTADNIGISRASYVAYEKGRVVPTLDILIKLADYLHVSIDYLINRDIYSDDLNTKSNFQNILDLGIQIKLLTSLLQRESLPITSNGKPLNDSQKRTARIILQSIETILQNE